MLLYSPYFPPARCCLNHIAKDNVREARFPLLGAGHLELTPEDSHG